MTILVKSLIVVALVAQDSPESENCCFILDLLTNIQGLLSVHFVLRISRREKCCQDIKESIQTADLMDASFEAKLLQTKIK